MALTIIANNNKKKKVWEVRLVGEVDISNAHLFRSQLETALTEARQNITIDLAELNYIDSTGFGVIMGTHTSIKNDGFGIKILNPRDSIKKLLNVTGMDKILS